MKRSQSLHLCLMGVPLMALAACGDEPRDALVYPTLDECVKDGQLTAVACSTAYARTLAQHREVAPRFENQSECEGEYGSGRCESMDNSEGHWFIPMMAGFMASQVINQGRSFFGGGTVWPPVQMMGGRYSTQPLYKKRGGEDWRSAGDQSLGRGLGKTVVSSGDIDPPKKAITVGRHGFGSLASARGSWGS